MTDLGDISHYLGMKIDVELSKKTITLWQSTYMKKILGQYAMTDCRSAKIPISPRIAELPYTLLESGRKEYCCLVLISCRRYDVAGYAFSP